MHVPEMTPQEYATLRQTDRAPALIDVREPWEFAHARIEGARLLPLGGIFDWAPELNRDASYVVMCHHGLRSAQAVLILKRLGFNDVWNLSGGIDAWARHVDSGVPVY